MEIFGLRDAGTTRIRYCNSAWLLASVVLSEFNFGVGGQPFCVTI